MIIYLDNRPLVRSRIFEGEDEEKERRSKLGYLTNENFNRDWQIYTFNSRERLSSEDDETKHNDLNVVWVGLEDYVPRTDSFEVIGLNPPDHLITVTGYSSFINTPLENIENLCKTLDNEGVLCLVPYPSNGAKSVGEGFWDNAKYRSAGLKRLKEIQI